MNRKKPTRRPQRRPTKKAVSPTKKAATPRKKAATPRKNAVVAALDPPILADAEGVDIEALAPPLDSALPSPATSVEEGLVAAPLPDVPLAEPELGYAARMAPPPPERPVPGSRRAVFFDVENSSHAPYIERTVHRLAIDRSLARTDFVAVGNWRVIGLDTARLLARLGAQLVHSAPATGVRDWSDLRIAVSAGVWLAAARPGDVIEIVSDDRAFDAIGDVAASLGIEFHRLSHRALSGAPGAVEAREETPAPRGHRRGRRSRRSGAPSRASGHAGSAERRHPAPARMPTPPAPPPPAPAPVPVPTSEAEPHTAPHDEIVQVVQELVDRSPGRPVLIDTLARELKARGFARPPGSPRLITRLRRIRELSVSPTGMITLIGAGQPAARPVLVTAEPVAIARPVAPEPVETEVVEDEDEVDGNRRDAPPAPAAAARQQRPGAHRRRRGGRGRKRATA